MQDHEDMKTKSSSPGFQDASQQEAEALERWLDDGGASDKKAASDTGVGDCSPLPLLQP